MIVTPELLDHPKFLRLKKRVGDLAAEYLLRLWGHAQTGQKGSVWPRETHDAEYIACVCRWPGDPEELFTALHQNGWLDLTEEAVIIHDWADYNARYAANWKNGPKGGRKPNQNTAPASVNPRRTHGLPKPNHANHVGSPVPTHREPTLQEKRREEKRESEDARAPEEPVIPTPEEIIAWGQMGSGIPEDYCHHYHNRRSVARTWTNARHQLIDWRKDIVSWWAKDRNRWKKSPGEAGELEKIADELAWQEDPQKREALKKRQAELTP